VEPFIVIRGITTSDILCAPRLSSGAVELQSHRRQTGRRICCSDQLNAPPQSGHSYRVLDIPNVAVPAKTIGAQGETTCLSLPS